MRMLTSRLEVKGSKVASSTAGKDKEVMESRRNISSTDKMIGPECHRNTLIA